MGRSLYLKMVLILVLMIVSVMAVVGTFLINSVIGFYLDEFSQQMSNAFSGDVEFVSDLQRSTESADAATLMAEKLRAYSGSLGIDISYRNFYVLDGKTGSFLAGSDISLGSNLELTPNILSAIAGTPGWSRSISDQYIDVAVPFSGKSGDFIIYIKDTKQRLQSLTTEIFKIIVQALLVGLAIAFALALLLSKTLTIPIENITRGAKLMASGKFTKRLVVHSRDEIGVLTKTFNDMAQTLQETLEAIGRERDKLETLFLHMSDGVAAFTRDGAIIHMNPAAERLLRTKMSQNPTYDSLFGRQASISELANLKQPDYIYREYRVGKCDLKLSLATFGGDESDGGILAIVHDVTEQRRLEAVRREFVANVSHELRTPLTSVRSYAETLESWDDIAADTRSEFLSVIINETDRMTRIVKDLLTLSQLDYGKVDWQMAKFSLEKSLRDTVNAQKMEARRRGHELILEIPDSFPEFFGDRERIEQVFVNILSNSIKYTPDGGRIEVNASTDAENIVIEFADNGIGIPKNDIPRLFERFFRVDKARSREFGGTGLGLAIAKEIIEYHNGDITVESDTGSGTVIKIELPLPHIKANETETV